MSNRERRLLGRELTKLQQEVAGLKDQPPEAKGMKKPTRKLKPYQRNKDPSYRAGKNALSDGELLKIVEEHISKGTGHRKLAINNNAPQTVIRNAIINYKAGLPLRSKRTKYRTKVSEELVNNVKTEIERLTGLCRAPILEFREDEKEESASSSNSASSTRKSEKFIAVVKRIHDGMLEKEHGKHIDDIPEKLRLNLSESSYRNLAERVGVIGKTSSGSNIQNERRTEAQCDIYNYISLAVAMQAVTTPLLMPALMFNLDKSSSFLNNASETKFIYSESMAIELRQRHRGVKVTKTTPQRRSTSYAVVTSANGDTVATIVLLVDSSFNKNSLERCEIGGKLL